MLKSLARIAVVGVSAACILTGSVPPAAAADPGWTLLGWNDLGMHCMDADYSVMAILPPYNTIHAQLVDPDGDLLTDPAGITVTYEAVADPVGSLNTSSIAKTDFWDHVLALFGVSPSPDTGLAGFSMPGAANTAQAMSWEPAFSWFTAEGIPLTPYDNGGAKNYYPLMRLVARDAGGGVLATSDIVLPVSDEMDCSACHAPASAPAAEPAGGWIQDPDPQRAYRLNILAVHDDRQSGTAKFSAALAATGYNSAGLLATVTDDGRPILCAKCHSSNALPGTGQAGLPPLTRVIHDHHAGVTDPLTGGTLGAATNRTACYRCHPGSETGCLRGAMGKAIGGDGVPSMQCQSCHGGMQEVGDGDRAGWFDEPNCQACHTGTALANNGQIRYLEALTAPGVLRQAVDPTFATTPNTPSAGHSLFRFSTGHGGLQCSACHGSTHAVFPSAHGNDNIRNADLQGHGGTLVECATCHGQTPESASGGPHGMHAIGPKWAEDHDKGSLDRCRACHGLDWRGTVLSRAQGDRSFNIEFGNKTFWRGYQIGCYTCHLGPDDHDANPNHAPSVADASALGNAGAILSISVNASDGDGDTLTLRIVSQPAHGAAWFAGSVVSYRSDPTFEGIDAFTVAASDGMADSNLATVTVTVVPTVVDGIFADGFESGDLAAWSP